MKGKDLKPHISIFGRTNVGKSSLINAITNQEVSIVSAEAGTTTDPVKKSIEIFGIGPVIIHDTAGIDDVGTLGKQRIEKTRNIIPIIDFAILLITDNLFGKYELDLINEFEEYDVPYILVHGKSDLNALKDITINDIRKFTAAEILEFNLFDNELLQNLINKLVELMPENAYKSKSLFKELINPKDIVLLVTPIDTEAPEGRMILPQVMAIRDILDNYGICITVRETELGDLLKTGIKPLLVVTDSQAFKYVNQVVPSEIQLTSFSILFARYRGNFQKYLEGTPEISNLKDGDRILMLESCTHQLSCDDIGRYKIPKWLKKYTGKELSFEYSSGLCTFPREMEEYQLAIQCGGCVITEKQLNNRLKPFIKRGIPVTNYGMTIAYVNGIFDRVISPFKTELN
ncbi:MAG: [FeFe] hydrogenase H-cluster maturation GTPase HydF [Ignavibacteria bacterium GWF2_33_9]|nr:MAG: [FeFe] hydrogenase H-cluster maturation GTPase HydF [Ignavibacteria bacterium GWF2_33_9]